MATRQGLLDLFSGAIKNYSTSIYDPNLVANWMDEGQIDIVLRTQCLTDTKSILTVASTREYALGTDVMKVLALTLDGKEVQPSSQEQMAYYASYPAETANGTPTHYYIKMATNPLIGFTPIPDTSGQVISLHYLRRPASLMVTANNPEIPEQYQRLIVKFAMYNVLIKDVKKDTLALWKEEYEKGVERMAEAMRNFDKKASKSMKFYGTEHKAKSMQLMTRSR